METDMAYFKINLLS